MFHERLQNMVQVRFHTMAYQTENSPDESQTGINVRVFLALLQDKRVRGPFAYLLPRS